MSKSDIRDLLEASAEDFDPLAFVTRIFATLQNLSSDISARPNQLFSAASDVEPTKGGESRLNTFLRLIGFPATREEAFLRREFSDDSLEEKLSQFGTLNYFNTSELATFSKGGKGASQQVLEREQILSEKKTVEDFFKMVSTPLPIDVSVEGKGSRRPSLFPLIVSADIPVYPLSKRVAPAFHKGDYVRGSARLSRPFIEHVIYMRTKNFSGAANPLKDALRANIEAEIGNKSSGGSNTSGDERRTENPQESVLKNIDDFSLLELQLIDKFIKALKSSVSTYVRTQKVNEQLRKQLLFIPDNRSEISEKAGQASVSQTEKENLLTSLLGEEDPNINSRVIDAKRQKLNEQRALVESFIQLLPVDSINRADRIRRLSDPYSTGNIIGDVFVSEFNDLTSFELTTINKKLAELKEEEKRVTQKYEIVKSTFMACTGEMTGLSIFDVICVLFALFTADLKYVAALLNASSLKRLKESDLFYSSQVESGSSNTGLFNLDLVEGAESISVSEALANIQEEVKAHFALAISFYKEAVKGGENRVQEST